MVPKLNSRSDKSLGDSDYSYQRLSANILHPKYSGSFILESLTNRSHQVNSIILCGPCFAVVCLIKPGEQC